MWVGEEMSLWILSFGWSHVLIEREKSDLELSADGGGCVGSVTRECRAVLLKWLHRGWNTSLHFLA